MGELWLLLQRSLHCLFAECGMDSWSSEVCYEAAAPGVTKQQLLYRHPDALSFPVAFPYGRTSQEALGIRHLPALAVIFGCPVSAAGLERFGSDSGLIQSVCVTSSVLFSALPFESWLYSKDCPVT